MGISFRDAIFWIAAASCAVASVAILRSTVVLLRHRPAEDLPPTLPSGRPIPRARGVVEIAWAVLPMVALALLLVATRRQMHQLNQPATTPDASVADSSPSAPSGLPLP